MPDIDLVTALQRIRELELALEASQAEVTALRAMVPTPPYEPTVPPVTDYYSLSEFGPLPAKR